MRLALLAASAVIALAGAGCGEDCVDIDLECTPQYAPTFDNIYTNTLEPRCGLPGTACHSVDGAQGGLILDDPETAYSRLLESRVLPGDASCSELTRRIDAAGPGPRMPPGGMLEPEVVCAIEQWIENGAQR